MYSVILMTAITAGSAAPDHWFRSGRGCHSGYNGCHGCAGCSGCAGCHGCNGGCYGSYGYLAVGGHLCHGGNGCGCYGGHGCWGCYGGSSYYGTGHYNPFGCYGCYGCYGGYSCYGYALPHHGHIVDPGTAPPTTPKTEETPVPKTKAKVDEEARLKNRARVIVQLPGDARLFIDGNLMTTKSERRTFQTPDLIQGQTYFYDLKVEVEREGRLVSETQRVTLRPGQEVTASFRTMNAPADATARRE